uniref:Uncharacterized protein n=1 Tax=Eutreptiella gymnastica TaxID=73025 RepID=A0A7S1J8A0_9EUGL
MLAHRQIGGKQRQVQSQFRKDIGDGKDGNRFGSSQRGDRQDKCRQSRVRGTCKYRETVVKEQGLFLQEDSYHVGTRTRGPMRLMRTKTGQGCADGSRTTPGGRRYPTDPTSPSLRPHATHPI